jgi:hypothetical protein
MRIGRRSLLASAVGSVAAVGLEGRRLRAQQPGQPTAAGSRSEARDIGNRRQLFIDDRFIARSQGVTLTLNPPAPGQPIEGPVRPYSYVSVIEHEGVCFLYYFTAGGVGVVTSDDGLTWRRPGQQGDTSPCLALPAAAEGTVFIDPNAADAYAFKAIFGVLNSAATASSWGPGLVPITTNDMPPVDGKQRPGEYSGAMYLFRSRDGLRWEVVPKVAVPFACDTQNQVLYDSRRARYAAYLRGFPMNPGSPHRSKRVVCRTETANLLDMPWPFRRNPHRPAGTTTGCYSYIFDEMEVVLAADERDPPRTDVYNPCVHLYPYADDAYLAFPSLFRSYGYGARGGRADSHGRDFRGEASGDGLFEVQLAVSRDGVTFTRHRVPYLRPGLIRDRRGTEGDPDCGLQIMGIGMIRRGDAIYQYYVGGQRTHIAADKAREWGIRGEDAVYRVVQRLDGFMSADAGADGGELVTPPVIFAGDRLVLNADCGGLGEIWVELQDAEGRPLTGHSLDEAVSIDRNGTTQEVWWRQGPDLTAYSGQPVRLRFKLRSAKLYAFQFQTPAV